MARLGPKQRRKIGNVEMAEWLEARGHGNGMTDFDRDWDKLRLMRVLLDGDKKRWEVFEWTRDILSAWEYIYKLLKKSKGEKYERLGN